MSGRWADDDGADDMPFHPLETTPVGNHQMGCSNSAPVLWGLPPGSRVRAQLLGDFWAATIIALSADGVAYTVQWDSDDSTCTVSADQVRPLQQLKVGTMVWATDADGKERQATIKTMLTRGYMVRGGTLTESRVWIVHTSPSRTDGFAGMQMVRRMHAHLMNECMHVCNRLGRRCVIAMRSALIFPAPKTTSVPSIDMRWEIGA